MFEVDPWIHVDRQKEYVIASATPYPGHATSLDENCLSAVPDEVEDQVNGFVTACRSCQTQTFVWVVRTHSWCPT